MPQYDALLVVSFGGPEGPDDVLPFLENVVRGKRVPRKRLLEVAEHYQRFGGVSPLNAHNRALIEALRIELAERGPKLPIYWGNRNWHPLLADALRQMADDGITRALAFVTSAYSSYSSCRQYLEDIARARDEVGHRAPQVDKLRAFYNHPGFVEPMAAQVRAALEAFPPSRRETVHLIYTGHSIPTAMAGGCRYEEQLREASRLVSGRVGPQPWQLAYQTRSGPPDQPWLEPDIGDCLERLHADGRVHDLVVVPIGFVADHMEVVYDLDTEVQTRCDALGMHMVRAATVGTHPRFVQMIRQLIVERMSQQPERLALGCYGPSHDVCPADCCPPGQPAGGHR
ncbi:MAG: ferrochelatase [Planctomycetes bacterium RBG_16_64_10]|nr:MAG: ferrochelatase [Planctomycetes bacterium RBG_16_64_10]